MGFKEQYVFLLFKDRDIGNKNRFDKMVSKYGIDTRDVYIAIVNYQVKTYGETITTATYVGIEDTRDRVRARKKQRRETRGIGKNYKIERWKDYEVQQNKS